MLGLTKKDRERIEQAEKRFGCVTRTSLVEVIVSEGLSPAKAQEEATRIVTALEMQEGGVFYG